jgi:hypothetical protein
VPEELKKIKKEEFNSVHKNEVQETEQKVYPRRVSDTFTEVCLICLKKLYKTCLILLVAKIIL